MEDKSVSLLSKEVSPKSKALVNFESPCWQFPYINFKALYAMVELQKYENYKYSKFTANVIALSILFSKHTKIFTLTCLIIGVGVILGVGCVNS